ncbi:MAG: hypothetical protein V1779_12490 [bacterium]
MKKNNIKYFGFASAVFVVIIFIFNFNHLNQQGTYENIFSQIAINLIHGKDYTCSALGNLPLLYPLWGYTGIVLIDTLFDFNNALVMLFQYSLCLIVIKIFYKIYQINPKYRHLFYFLPFIAMMSVKWPDAIVGALLFLYGYFVIKSIVADLNNGQFIMDNEQLRNGENKKEFTIHNSQFTIKKSEVGSQKSIGRKLGIRNEELGIKKPGDRSQETDDGSQTSFDKLRMTEVNGKWKYMILSGIVLGLILNFRTEYLFMPLVFLVFISFPQMKGRRKVLFQTTIVSWTIAVIFLLPWAFRAKNISGDLQFTASNSGAVMFLSLGQLPNNKWGIAPYDKTVYDIADSLGYPSPYSYQANTYFNQKSSELIIKHPVEFAKKMGYNFFSIWKGGIYTGEYANYFISENRRNEIDNLINSAKGVFNKINVILNLRVNESISLFFEKALQGIFIPVLFLLMALFILSYYKQKGEYFNIVFLVGAAIILYKIAIVCLVQYEYRHINSIYLFLLGTGMKTFIGKEKG